MHDRIGCLEHLAGTNDDDLVVALDQYLVDTPAISHATVEPTEVREAGVKGRHVQWLKLEEEGRPLSGLGTHVHEASDQYLSIAE